MPDAFLSYKREDMKAATRLVEGLRAAGLDVWWDRDIPAAAPWEATIERALADAKVVLVCWSKAAVASENVRSEARWAREQGRLIQLFVEPCSPPLFFGERQGVDLSDWDGEPGDPRFRDLVAVLKARLGQAASAPAASAPPSIIEPQPSRRARPLAWVGGAVAVLALSAVILLGALQFAAPKRDGVALKLFDVAGDAPLARTFAAGVSDDVASALSAAGVTVIGPDAPAGERNAAFVLDGRAELAGSDLHLTSELEDARDHTVLWSTSFTRASGEVQAMQEQVAAKLAGVLHCALDTLQYPDGRIETNTAKLYLRACDLEQSSDPHAVSQVRDLFEQVTEREPRFALGWAQLAMVANSAALVAPPEQAAAIRQEAQAAAATALRLDPKNGLAYAALAALGFGRVSFAELHRRLQKALSVDPDNAQVINTDGELILRMGRIDDAVTLFRRGVSLAPLAPGQTADLVQGLVDDGRLGEAQTTLERALRVWPDDDNLKGLHLQIEARYGDPDAALSLLKNPAARPAVPDTNLGSYSDTTLESYRRLAQARKSGRPADVQAFVAWATAAVASGGLHPVDAVPALANVGAVDAAFQAAERVKSVYGVNNLAGELDTDPAVLWWPEMDRLRRDARFIPLAAKLGVVDFWRPTGLWPDFCSTPNWPYDCKAEAAKVAPSSSH